MNWLVRVNQFARGISLGVKLCFCKAASGVRIPDSPLRDGVTVTFGVTVAFECDTLSS
jgi:hypothetical protein